MRSSLIVSGSDDSVRLLFAEKLISVTRRDCFKDMVSFYQIENDVPYLAEMLCTSVKWGSLDFETPGYWLEPEEVLDSMNPVLAQSSGDKLLMALAVMGRYPRGLPEYSGLRLGQKFYRVASVFHPQSSLKPTFSMLSLDFPVWAKVLPSFGREISLVI